MPRQSLHARHDAPLTARQLHVLQEYANGSTAAEVGAELFITNEGVYSCMELVKVKLRATTATHAVAEGFRRGLIK